MKGRESVTRSVYISNEVRLVILLQSCICLTPLVSKSVHISINQLLCVCGCGEREIVELSTGEEKGLRESAEVEEGRLWKAAEVMLPLTSN